MKDNNAISVLYKEMDWLQSVIEQQIKTYLLQEGHENNWLDIPIPDLAEVNAPYAEAIKKWQLDIPSRLALALSIAPHFRPEVLDIFFGKNQIYDRRFTEFGGITDKNHSGFLPTGQTLNFLLTAADPEMKIAVLNILGKDNILIREQVIIPGETEEHVPRLNGVLGLSNSWYHYFVTGEQLPLDLITSLQVKKITTELEWKDVVLDSFVMDQVNEIMLWMEHSSTILNDWNLNKTIKPGYCALFYGPQGTGKTLIASLLGKASGREVYKINTLMVFSKYIGETEKNLSKIFRLAEHKNWILFFEDADLLFATQGEETKLNNEYLNKQRAFLLQCIEDFPGLVIFTADFKSNLEERFIKRLQSVIYFPMPSLEERYQLWKSAFSGACTLNSDIDIYKISEDYELTGGDIINVLRYCALSAIRRKDSVVTKDELITGIKCELKKQNKIINEL